MHGTRTTCCVGRLHKRNRSRHRRVKRVRERVGPRKNPHMCVCSVQELSKLPGLT